MPWNGGGTFNRLFSWSADRAAGLDISSSRMDSDSNDIASQGFGNVLTRDGQGQPSANLPMAGFRHTGVQNAVARSDYAAFGQVQDGLFNWTVAGGSADAITAVYTPALTVLNDGQICFVRAGAANATTTPTFAPNGLTARTITKLGGGALAIGDIAGNLAEIVLRYNLANTRWELLNPSNVVVNTSLATTGDGKLTLKTSADSGWVLCDDGTIGSATSGASNRANADCQALFNLLYASPFTDSTAPLFTSAGAGTTRAAQGTAAAAWAANCRMSLTKNLGRALAIAGTGSGLTARALGAILGEETHLSTLSETPTGITSANASQAITTSLPGAGKLGYTTNGDMTAISITSGASGVSVYSPANTWAFTGSLSANNSIAVTSNNTGGAAHNNMQPTSFWNVMVKL